MFCWLIHLMQFLYSKFVFSWHVGRSSWDNIANANSL
jgi:hypothetical protein